MAARGYEFYLRVLKVSLTSERSERVRDTFSTSDHTFRDTFRDTFSTSDHVMFCLLYRY